MNQFASLNTSSTLTMSSREIAELTKKSHKNVLTDIRTMLAGLSKAAAEFSATAQIEGPNNSKRSITVFLLPKRETLILVSGYSVELRARIIDRWMELEEQQMKAVPQPITATEVSTLMAKYMADMQETIVAPLVNIVADPLQNHQPTRRDTAFI
ncbi:UNVERIFIED_ORG: phage regulator Rha-like protein [Rhizobium esperanzae]|nr:phage regulator Rha-like protein [Rhizobium esperanzae]